MKYEECTVLIIHVKSSIDRLPFIANIHAKFPNTKIMDAITPNDLRENEIDFFTSFKNFKRRPGLKLQNLLGRVCCFQSHRNCLEYIVDNKLDNVIIMEDDAYIVDDSFLKDEIPTEYEMIYLGHGIYKTKAGYGKTVQTHSIYYRDWKVAESIIDFINGNQDKWRAWDLFLDKEILPFLNYKLNKYLDQASITSKKIKSLISMEMKVAPFFVN